MIPHFAEIYEKKFNHIIFLHKNKRDITTSDFARFYIEELMNKLEFVIKDLQNDDINNQKFYFLKNKKYKKIAELKAHLILLSLIKFLYINKNRLTYMNELRNYIYSYGLNIDLKTCDAFNSPVGLNLPLNINKDKILKFVRLCDFESLVKIFENLYSHLMTSPNLENDYINEHVELGQISNMLKDFFDFYRKIMGDKITMPENHLNNIRGKIKDVK